MKLNSYINSRIPFCNITLTVPTLPITIPDTMFDLMEKYIFRCQKLFPTGFFYKTFNLTLNLFMQYILWVSQILRKVCSANITTLFTISIHPLLVFFICAVASSCPWCAVSALIHLTCLLAVLCHPAIFRAPTLQCGTERVAIFTCFTYNV